MDTGDSRGGGVILGEGVPSKLSEKELRNQRLAVGKESLSPEEGSEPCTTTSTP